MPHSVVAVPGSGAYLTAEDRIQHAAGDRVRIRHAGGNSDNAGKFTEGRVPFARG